MPEAAIGPDVKRTALAALACVCLFWGTTYLGIRIALETVPPLYLIATRYVISGSILLVAAKLLGWKYPNLRDFWLTAVFGAICIGIGNGFLAMAETHIPSGLAALFYTTAPFCMVGIDALLPGGKRPRALTVGGLLIGFAGVAFLLLPAIGGEGVRGNTFLGFILIEISVGGWVLGSLLQKRVHTAANVLVVGAIQQVAAGTAMFAPASLFEKFPETVSLRSELAIVYLIFFGSIVGFSCFVYAMTHLPVAIVSIYTFVNPIVAIALGWLLLREPFGMQEFMATMIIFAGIATVRWSERSRQMAKAVPAPQEASTAFEAFESER